MLTAALALVLADTPEATLKEFVANWNQGNALAAARLVDGANLQMPLGKITALLKAKESPRITVTSIRRKGNQLIANVDVKGPTMEPLTIKDDTIDVVQRADGWKLVAPDEAKPNSILGGMASVLKTGGENANKPKTVSAQKDVAMSNMKQIALGTLMYTADWDDVMKMSPETAKEKISPYIKNLQVFVDPATGKDNVYVFNTRLTNVPSNYVKYPAETVLWSLGPQGGLLFPYDGKTIIAFADGHVKALDKTEVAKLRWTPDN